MSGELVSDDFVRTFRLGAAGVRGRHVRLGHALDTILMQHNYPQAVSRLLGELTALAAVLSSTVKFDGVFTVQTNSNGPLHMMVADITSAGALRGYANFDSNALAAVLAEDEYDSVPQLLGAGHLAFTVDQGPEGDRYQGIVALEGASLSDCAHNYFRQSEQIATAIQLGAQRTDSGWRAGALMLQREPADGGNDWPVERDTWPKMPSARPKDQEDWRRAVILMSSLTVGELLDPVLSSDRLLFRLFHDESVHAHVPLPLVFSCRCSRHRVETTLKALKREEIEELTVDGDVIVTCQFCNNSESFGKLELDAIYTA